MDSSSDSSSTPAPPPPTTTTPTTTECSYYLAESTIPNAGWGLFTAKTLYENDHINLTNGESGVNVVDLTTQHGTYLHTLYHNYMWIADVMGAHNEGGGRTVYVTTGTRSTAPPSSSSSQQQPHTHTLPGNVLTMITGIGGLANGHPLDYNIVPYQIPIPHPPLHHPQQQQQHRSSSNDKFVISRHSKTPTAGAITYYHDLQYFAYNNRNQNYNTQNTPATSRSSSSNNRRHVTVPAGGELIINYGTGWDTRFDFSQYRIHPPERPQQNIRSLPYLERHGYCVDSIVSTYPHVSNVVPRAGYGGVARRAISKDRVIIPVPTIPIHRYGLHMGRHDKNKNNNNDTKVAQQQQQQLLLNYVLGHIHSNLLLVPLGPGIQLINHHATQYNAILRWSSVPTTTAAASISDQRQRPSWVMDPQNVTIQQLLQEQPGGKLVLELVAIRDIVPGEEILIHYGAAWEDAYQRHVTEWEHMSIHMNDAYVYAHEMNERMEYQMPLRTTEEQTNDPYPFNVQMECYFVPHFYREVTKRTMTGESDHRFVEWNPANDPNSINTKQIYHPHQLQPCQIHHRRETTTTTTTKPLPTAFVYTVQMIDVPYPIHNVPRHMIVFRDVPYTQDQHLRNVFRHEIQLPDEVFPSHWKDLLQ